MRTRVLMAHEMEAAGGEVLPFVAPQNVAFAVVEDEEGHVIARLGVYSMTYYEGVWIDPEHRGNLGVLRALLQQAAEIPRVRGESWVYAGAAFDDAAMQSYLGRMGGTKIPMQPFCVPVNGGESCRKQ